MNIGRTQNPDPCKGDSRRNPNHPTTGKRSLHRRGGAFERGADQGLIDRGV
jgi:hypothetical protein